MRLKIYKSYQEISKWTANYIVERINDFSPTSAKPFVLGLPTGSSPIGTFQELISLNKAGKVSFKNVITFNMDEYVGIPETHPESFHSFMDKNLFNHIDIARENINIPNGNADDLNKEALAYEERIRELGGIRLFLGGMGTDGHLAFNVPFSPINSRTRVVNLNYDAITSNARFFENNLQLVPKQAISVGVQTVLDAREIITIVNGYKKAIALQHVVEGPVTHVWTSSALQLHPHVTIVCDEEAIMELKVGTVRYFQEMKNDFDS